MIMPQLLQELAGLVQDRVIEVVGNEVKVLSEDEL